MYDLGLACARNVKTAAEWYRKGAKAENPLAENNLADLYLKGEGVPHDDFLAFAWFQKDAAQGHTGARIKLGSMYADGRPMNSSVRLKKSCRQRNSRRRGKKPASCSSPLSSFRQRTSRNDVESRFASYQLAMALSLRNISPISGLAMNCFHTSPVR